MFHRLSNSLILSIFLAMPFSMQAQAYLNTSLSNETRAKDLLSRLTLEEKVSLLGYRSKAVERLGIPAYNWWNEALHGVARAGNATIFPQAIGMAATFDDDLVKAIGNTISTEARAKYNLAKAAGKEQQYMGLSFWTPNINIFRDPRWGRGQETYGEDPYLTATVGAAFVKGMQGNDPEHLKVSATAKHFAAHSGPEATRDYFNAVADEKDLRETYLYAFRALVKAGVESVMTAYNEINGVPNSVNKWLVHDVLRNEWRFKGHVVTDCGALDDVFTTHKVIPSATEAAAMAIKAGIDLDCSSVLQDEVVKAVHEKLLSEAEVDTAVYHLLRTEMRFGFFDRPEASPYRQYGIDSIHNAAYITLARKAAQESMVLLKNDKHVLPLHIRDYNSVMVVGPNAASLDAMVGNYHGVSDKVVNFVEGITAAVGPATRVEYDLGCDYKDTVHFGGIWAASNADVTIAVLGLSPVLEGEAGDAFLSASGGDKKDLSLPASEIAFMRELRKSVKKPVIAIITAGSDVDIAAIAPYADAVVLAWYPGEQGGNALADILFGKVSPSGRLPVTFYRSINDLPAFDDYHMKDRTYRYFKGVVQYPFGYGLSYSSFAYRWARKPELHYEAGDTIKVKVHVGNIGNMDADEVVQAYIQYPSADRMPLKELKGFKRVYVPRSEVTDVVIKIPVSDLRKWDLKQHKWRLYPGTYTLSLGGSSAERKLDATFKIY